MNFMKDITPAKLINAEKCSDGWWREGSSI